MAPSVMIQSAVVVLLVVSSAFADVIHLNNVNTNEKSTYSNPSEQPYKAYGPPAAAASAFDRSFATTGPPKSASYGSSAIPSSSYGSSAIPSSSYGSSAIPSSSYGSSAIPSSSSYDADSYSSNAAFSAIGQSVVSGGSFPSSTQSPYIESSTPVAQQYYGSYGSPAPVSSSAPAQVISNRSPSFDGASFSSFAPSHDQEVTITESQSYDYVPEEPAANVPAPHSEVTINKEVPVPYYVQVEKKIPYPVLVRVPHPYPVTVEKHVPYAVRVNVDRPIHVPQPYPVEVEKRVPYPVEKPVPYEVRVPVDRPYPVHVPYEKPVPYAVDRPVPYPVRVEVDRPYPVEKPVPYPVTVEKPVPYPVDKPVPYPVEKLVPYPVEKRVPYPVKYEVPVNVPVPVEVRVPVTVDRPVPYPVEKKVPYPVQVPYEVKVPVPVQAPAQRFATVHYYQQSPVVFSGSYQNGILGSASQTGAYGRQDLLAAYDGVQNNGAFGQQQQTVFESSKSALSGGPYSAGLVAGDASSSYRSQDFEAAAREGLSTGGLRVGNYGSGK